MFGKDRASPSSTTSSRVRSARCVCNSDASARWHLPIACGNSRRCRHAAGAYTSTVRDIARSSIQPEEVPVRHVLAAALALGLVSTTAAQDFVKKRLDESPRHHEWVKV